MRTAAGTTWWRRLTRRAAPRAAAADEHDAADLGTCFGLEAVLQAEEEARALAAERAAEARSAIEPQARPAL